MTGQETRKKPELLAPVRDQVSLVAAIVAGADAVYLGVGELNMRVNSRGIPADSLADSVRYAHDKGVKVYLTLNTVIYDSELAVLDEILAQAKAAQVDAVICWDMAVIMRAKKLGLPLHISTQASISNSESARYYRDLGATRFVLARELTLEQIAEIRKAAGVEVEVFCHGAMCVSISGRCFISEFLHGRSANKGDCLQPCRAEYLVKDPDSGKELAVGNNYVLSPKDLCTLPIIDRMIEAGIDSFKIEGRSRSPEYVAKVVDAYRRAIDAYFAGSYGQKLVEELMSQVGKVYNRGFSSGFLLGRPTVNDWSGRYGSVATEKKVFCGKLINYFANAGVGYVEVTAQPVSVGDTVQVHGNATGVVEFVIEQLLDENGGPITTANKCRATFPCPVQLRKNDDLYKIVSQEDNS